MSFTEHLQASYSVIRARLRGLPVPIIAAKPKPRPLVLSVEAQCALKGIPVPEPKQEPKSSPDWLFINSIPTPMSRIAYEVAKKSGFTVQELRGPTRIQEIVTARFEFCYRSAAETKNSYISIGKYLNRDRTTVMHAIKAHCARYNLPHPRGREE